jgi:hypothetical protein
MTVLSGWRGALVILAGLVLFALLLTAILWLAIALGVLLGVAWFNWMLLPRVATRLHIPLLALAIALLVPLAGLGYLASGITGALEGAVIWLLGVAVPRALLWRFRGRVRSRSAERQTIIVPYRP